jgi:putative endonuclease
MRGRIILPLYTIQEMYVTYILYSPKVDKFYTGQTTEIDRRLEEHNRGKTPFMASGMPWKLVFLKEYPSRAEAIKLEHYIKKRGAARFLADNNLTTA